MSFWGVVANLSNPDRHAQVALFWRCASKASASLSCQTGVQQTTRGG